MLVLKTGQAPAGRAAIADAAIQELGLAEEPIKQTLALKAGEFKPDSSELIRLYGAFMSTVQNAADVVDQL